MAEMPRGQPRSVPDPDGERYDEMIAQERRRKARNNTIVIGRQLYREFDNGRANVLEPVIDWEAAARDTRDARRAVALAGNQLAGTAVGVASLLGASAKTLDQAFALGAIGDAVVQGIAPRGVSPRPQVIAPRPQTAAPPLMRPSIRFRGLNEHGQARGVSATLTSDMLGAGTRANRKLEPEGWDEFDTATFGRPNRARAHLLAREMGGTGDRMVNLMALRQNPTNSSHMRTFENSVVRKVRKGEVVEYSVTPFYDGGGLPPRAVFLVESGSGGGSSARIIDHPPGRKK